MSGREGVVVEGIGPLGARERVRFEWVVGLTEARVSGVERVRYRGGGDTEGIRGVKTGYVLSEWVCVRGVLEGILVEGVGGELGDLLCGR